MIHQSHTLIDLANICEQSDAAIDRWNNAALAAVRKQPNPGIDIDSMEGYENGIELRKACALTGECPESFYRQTPDGEC